MGTFKTEADQESTRSGCNPVGNGKPCSIVSIIEQVESEKKDRRDGELISDRLNRANGTLRGGLLSLRFHSR